MLGGHVRDDVRAQIPVLAVVRGVQRDGEQVPRRVVGVGVEGGPLCPGGAVAAPDLSASASRTPVAFS